MKKSKNHLFLFLVLGILLETGDIIPAYSEVVGKSIAIINGDAIFLSEFENNWKSLIEQHKKLSPDEPITKEWEKENKKMLLDQMIEEKLLMQEAKKRKIVVPKRQLEEGILQVKNRFKNIPPGTKPTKEDMERDLSESERKEFLNELKEQDLTEKQFSEKIEDQLRVMRLTENEIRDRIASPFKDGNGKGDEAERELTPEYEKEARALFAEIEKRFNSKDFKADTDNEVDQMVEVMRAKLGEAVRARHILVRSSRNDDMKKRSAALEKIRAIKKQLDTGADFIDLAKQKSEGPNSREGGDLGFFTRGQMVPEFEKVAFALPVGGISDVVETEFGYHIIMVEEKRAARRLRYDDIKMDLAAYLYQKKGRERYEQFVSDLRKKADVRILMDL